MRNGQYMKCFLVERSETELIVGSDKTSMSDTKAMFDEDYILDLNLNVFTCKEPLMFGSGERIAFRFLQILQPQTTNES